jgi:hypothetical protein
VQEGESLVFVSESDIAVDNRFRESGRIYLSGLQALTRLLVDRRRADLRADFNTAALRLRARAGIHSAIPEKT